MRSFNIRRAAITAYILLVTTVGLWGSNIVQQAYNLVQNAGTPVTRRSTINFTGAGVSVADTGGVTTVTITGGGSGGTCDALGGDVTGTCSASVVSKVHGATWPASPSAHQVPIITSAASGGTATYKTISDCSFALNFSQSTDAFGCSTQQRVITFSLDGGGSAITTGDVNQFPTAAFACTINRIDVSGSPSGSITVDIWKAAGAIPTSANKISASAPATLSSSQLNQNGSLTGWTTAVSSGDVFGATVATVSTVQKVTIQIWCS